MPRKTPPHRGRIIRTSIQTRAGADRLWNAWTDPDRLSQWFADRAQGRALEGSVVTWYFDRFGYELPYEVLTAVPGEHLVLTGETPGRPRFYLEVEITTAEGVSTLSLANSGFLDADGWDEEYEGIVSGWTLALGTLKQYVERHYGRPRSQFFAMRPAAFDYRDLSPYYRTREGLRAWLTRDGHAGDPGEPCALVLHDGSTLTGTVLAATGWEVLMSWDEIDGVLALKAFGLGGGRRAICVHGTGWGLAPERAATLESAFEPALDRLSGVLDASRPAPARTGEAASPP